MSDVTDRKRLVRGDDKFFKRHPDRQYRVRRAAPVEIREKKANGGLRSLPQGLDWFIAMRNFAPGYRMCLFTPNKQDADTNLNEDTARAVFEYVAEPYRNFEQRMASAAEGSHATHH